MLLKCQDVRVSRQAWAMFCEHSRSGTRPAFYKDCCQLLRRWICQTRVVGRSVSKNDKTRKKNALCGNADER